MPKSATPAKLALRRHVGPLFQRLVRAAAIAGQVEHPIAEGLVPLAGGGVADAASPANLHAGEDAVLLRPAQGPVRVSETGKPRRRKRHDDGTREAGFRGRPCR